MPLATPSFLDKAGLEFRPWVFKTAGTIENAKIPDIPDMPEIHMPDMPHIPDMPNVNMPQFPTRSRANTVIKPPPEKGVLACIFSGGLMTGCCARPESIQGIIIDSSDPTLEQLEQTRLKLESLKTKLEKDVLNSDATPRPPTPPEEEWASTPPLSLRKGSGPFFHPEELCTPPVSNRTSRSSSSSSQAGNSVLKLPVLLEVHSEDSTPVVSPVKTKVQS